VLVGGTKAVSIGWSGDRASVVLSGLSFVRNEQGVWVELKDGSEVGWDSTRLEITGCWIADKEFPADVWPVPVYQNPQYGLHFRAMQTSESDPPARIRATVVNLATSGAFPSIQGDSNLVEIYARGVTEEHSKPLNQLQKISSVLVDFDGGVLDGHATPGAGSAGWAKGVHVSLEYGTLPGLEPPFPYRTAAEARFQGTEIRDFRVNGIDGLASRYCRLLVELNQNTVVQGAGKHQTTPPTYPGSPENGTGIHLKSHEGYIALVGRGARITKNWGHGIALDVGALINFPGLTVVPWGDYVALEDCEVSRNGKDGLYLVAGNSGIVGGTWSFKLGSKRILGSPPTVVGYGAPVPPPLCQDG